MHCLMQKPVAQGPDSTTLCSTQVKSKPLQRCSSIIKPAKDPQGFLPSPMPGPSKLLSQEIGHEESGTQLPRAQRAQLGQLLSNDQVPILSNCCPHRCSSLPPAPETTLSSLFLPFRSLALYKTSLSAFSHQDPSHSQNVTGVFASTPLMPLFHQLAPPHSS